jgi:hypothetical protein
MSIKYYLSKSDAALPSPSPAVCRQGSYRWFQSPEGVRKKEDKRLLPEIRKIFMENRQVSSIRAKANC